MILKKKSMILQKGKGIDTNMTKDITNEINKVKDDITGPIKRNF